MQHIVLKINILLTNVSLFFLVIFDGNNKLYGQFHEKIQLVHFF